MASYKKEFAAYLSAKAELDKLEHQLAHADTDGLIRLAREIKALREAFTGEAS